MKTRKEILEQIGNDLLDKKIRTEVRVNAVVSARERELNKKIDGIDTSLELEQHKHQPSENNVRKLLEEKNQLQAELELETSSQYIKSLEEIVAKER